jgi:hypothetical protein
MRFKFILLLTLSLLANSLQAQNNNFDRLYREFSGKTDTQRFSFQKSATEDSISLESILSDKSKLSDEKILFMVTAFVIGGIIGSELKIDALEVLILEQCSEKIRTSFNKKARKCDESGYETLISADNKGDHLRILARKDGENITELVALFTGKSPIFVHIKGQIKASLLKESITFKY